MTTKPLPNGFGVNILDTAQLDPNYCIELVERFDMAQVTIVEATHPKEAFKLATDLKARRPHMTIFYRRWREHLKDERIPFQTQPKEIVEYFRDVFEAGLTACIYNESLVSPMTPLTDYSRDVIERTAPHGWETVHFKISMGNPGGYAGEHLLPRTNPAFRPDGYAESDGLWRAAYQANKPRIDAGKRPLVWIAPHAYFPITGLDKGLTDRHREIWRRLDNPLVDIPRHYIPLAVGETGLIKTNPLDVYGGWFGQTDAINYARIFAMVMTGQFLPDNTIAHLYAVGDKHPGFSDWKRFNLMRVESFWNTIEDFVKGGAWRVPYWYGEGYSFPIPAPPPTPQPPPPPPVPVPVPPPPPPPAPVHELEFRFRYGGLTGDQETRLRKAYAGFMEFLKYSGKSPDALAIPIFEVYKDGVKDERV